MTKRYGYGLATAAAALLAVATPATTLASSHREAPNITELPKVDGTDFYMFRSYEPGREGFVTFIANYQPLQDPGGGPNYYTLDQDAIYEIHIDNDGNAVEDITFQFKFDNFLRNDRGITLNVGGKDLPIALRHAGPIMGPDPQTVGELENYTVTMITGDRRSGTRAAITQGAGMSTVGSPTFRKPFDRAGDKSNPDYPAYIRAHMYNINIPGCATPGRMFVGQRAEGFAVNLGPSFDLVNYVPIEGDSTPGAGDRRGFPGGITQSRANDDLVGKKNVTSFAIEVPITCVTGSGNGVIGGWTTASLPQSRMLSANPTYEAPSVEGGAFVQVSRLSMPLVNELVIGLPQKNLFNAASPTQDGALADYVTNPTFPAILDQLFRGPVNATLGTNISNLAPSNFPRADLVATFLTGIATLNQQKTVTPSEMLRLNTAIAPTNIDRQSTFGVVGDDLAGFPNGRRPGDDTVDIVLRVAMGRLCHDVPIAGKSTNLGLCRPSDAPVGLVNFTDGAPIRSLDFQNSFPYLNNPLVNSPRPVH